MARRRYPIPISRLLTWKTQPGATGRSARRTGSDKPKQPKKSGVSGLEAVVNVGSGTSSSVDIPCLAWVQLSRHFVLQPFRNTPKETQRHSRDILETFDGKRTVPGTCRPAQSSGQKHQSYCPRTGCPGMSSAATKKRGSPPGSGTASCRRRTGWPRRCGRSKALRRPTAYRPKSGPDAVGWRRPEPGRPGSSLRGHHKYSAPTGTDNSLILASQDIATRI